MLSFSDPNHYGKLTFYDFSRRRNSRETPQSIFPTRLEYPNPLKVRFTVYGVLRNLPNVSIVT